MTFTGDCAKQKMVANPNWFVKVLKCCFGNSTGHALVAYLTCAPLGILEVSAFSAYFAAFAACWILLESSLFRKANLSRPQEASGTTKGKGKCMPTC